jgi:hypothetical protein
LKWAIPQDDSMPNLSMELEVCTIELHTILYPKY